MTISQKKKGLLGDITKVALIALSLFLFELAYGFLKGPSLVFSPDAKVSGTFPKKWIHGSKSAMDNDDPPVQVHAYNEHTFILRENKAINYEGAFMYLLFGNQQAILIDQGSTSSPALFPLREVIDEIIVEWENRNRQEVQLIVANSHLHGDHFAAWNQFVDRPNTLLVGLTHEEMMSFWGFKNYPEEKIIFDLGGREFLVTGAPGHQGSEIAIYDKWTDLLYTGDMFYRGRLYLENWEQWKESIRRLKKIADENPVSALINNHIEMTSTPKLDYPIGTTWQPNEPPMQMTLDMLEVAHKATYEIEKPGIYKYDHFLIYNEVPWAYTTDP